MNYTINYLLYYYIRVHLLMYTYINLKNHQTSITIDTNK